MKTIVRTDVQLKNILYMTDFSPAADAAAPYAAELAKRYGAKLHSLHVRPPVINPTTPPETWKGLEEAAEIVAERNKRDLLHRFAGVQTEVLIADGDFWNNVEVATEHRKIDMIVMGTRGRSGIGKLLLGSIAEEVFRKASCPVLTVGPHAPAQPKQDGEFTRILFATDFSPESEAAAEYAISLAQECQANLIMMHVIAEPKAGDLVGPTELAASYEQRLRNLVSPEAERWCVPDYLVASGKPAEMILEVATKQKVDLIVLGVRKPSGVPGAATHLPIATAHRVVSQAPCPVLTVRN